MQMFAAIPDVDGLDTDHGHIAALAAQMRFLAITHGEGATVAAPTATTVTVDGVELCRWRAGSVDGVAGIWLTAEDGPTGVAVSRDGTLVDGTLEQHIRDALAGVFDIDPASITLAS